MGTEVVRAQVRINKNGVTDIPSRSVPVGVTYLQWRMPRVNLADSNMTIDVKFEISFNGGTTWEPGGGFGAVGGVIINPKTGLPLDFTTGEVTFAQPANPNRRVRGAITITNNTKNILHDVALYSGEF